jgi:hypothetical protein
LPDGTASAPALAFADDQNTGVLSPGDNSLAFATSGTQRLVIDSSGQVGIGTTSPSYLLDVNNAVIQIGNSTDAFVQYKSTAGNWHAGANSSNAFAVYSGTYGSGTERMRIDSSGQVGIGTSSPTSKLNVEYGALEAATLHELILNANYGTSNNGGGRIGITFSGNPDGTAGAGQKTAGVYGVSTDNTQFTRSMGLVFNTSGTDANSTERMRIDSSGRVVIGATSTPVQFSVQNASTSLGIEVDTASGFASGPTLRGYHRPGSAYKNLGITGAQIMFGINDVEKVRIDSSGRLLAGTSSDTAPGAFNAKIQTASTSFDGSISLRRDSNNAGAQSLVFGKSRSSSLNGNTIVQSGDTLGTITFFGADGTDLNTAAAQMLAAVDGTPGSNDMPGRLVFSTTADGASGSTERMRIDSSGNLIQYSTGTLNRQHRQQSSSVYTATNIRSVIDGAAGYLTFDTNQNWTNGNAVERMRIDSSGNVLFAKTATGLQNDGFEIGAVGGGRQLSLTQSGNGVPAMYINSRYGSGTQSAIQFYFGTSHVGSINVTSTATAYVTSSDYRLKENVVDIADGIDRVKQLQPRRFNFIADADATVDGFLAHEAQTVVPEAITGTHNEVDDDGNAVMQGIDQSKLVPLLTAALQEAIAKIETLETKVAALEAQ